MPAFGRQPSPPDPRDYQMRPFLDTQRLAAFVPVNKHWRPGPFDLDQDGVGACVGFSGANTEQNSPLRTPVTNQTGFDLYNACKQIDGMPNVEGTYLRALFTVLRDQGRIAEYRWAATPDDLKEWVCTRGSVVVGTNWYEGMMMPTLHADRTISVTGGVVGGHAWLVRGYNTGRRYKGRNSWGAAWGDPKLRPGEFWIGEDALNRLLFEEGGEAIGIVEKRP